MSSRMRFFVCSSYPHFPQNVHIFIVKEKSNKKRKAAQVFDLLAFVNLLFDCKILVDYNGNDELRYIRRYMPLRRFSCQRPQKGVARPPKFE